MKSIAIKQPLTLSKEYTLLDTWIFNRFSRTLHNIIIFKNKI